MPLATPDPRRRLLVQGAMLGTLRLVAAFNVILLVAICLFLLVQGLPALSSVSYTHLTLPTICSV